MNKRCTVSVVLPTYNRATIIHKAIESVLTQTIKEIEIIVVDDCSTDYTLKVINQYNDKRIKYIRHQDRKGGSAARNTGIKYSKSEYIAFLDSDDQWFPHKLEKQISKFKDSSKDIGLIYTWLILYGQNNEVLLRYEPKLKGNLYRKLLLRNVIGTTSSVMVRSEIFDDKIRFDENLPAKQDQDLWIRISKKYKVDFVPEILVRVNQSKRNKRISDDKNNLLIAREKFFNKYQTELLNENICHLFLCNLAQFYYQYFGQKKEMRKYLIQAIKTKKISIRPYVLLFLTTILPESTYRNIRLKFRKLIDYR